MIKFDLRLLEVVAAATEIECSLCAPPLRVPLVTTFVHYMPLKLTWEGRQSCRRRKAVWCDAPASRLESVSSAAPLLPVMHD